MLLRYSSKQTYGNEVLSPSALLKYPQNLKNNVMLPTIFVKELPGARKLNLLPHLMTPNGRNVGSD